MAVSLTPPQSLLQQPQAAPLTLHCQADEQLPQSHGVLCLADVTTPVSALGAVPDGELGHVALLGDEVPPSGLDLHLWLGDAPQPGEPRCRGALSHTAGQGHVVTHKAGLWGLRLQ